MRKFAKGYVVAVFAIFSCLLWLVSASAASTFVGVSSGQTYTFEISVQNWQSQADTGTQTVTITNVSGGSPCEVDYTTTCAGDSNIKSWATTFLAQGAGNISVANATSLSGFESPDAVNFVSLYWIISENVANKTYSTQIWMTSTYLMTLKFQWGTNGVLQSYYREDDFLDTGGWLKVSYTQTPNSINFADGLAAVVIIIVIVVVAVVLATRRRRGQRLTDRNQPPPPPPPPPQV